MPTFLIFPQNFILSTVLLWFIIYIKRAANDYVVSTENVNYLFTCTPGTFNYNLHGQLSNVSREYLVSTTENSRLVLSSKITSIPPFTSWHRCRMYSESSSLLTINVTFTSTTAQADFTQLGTWEKKPSWALLLQLNPYPWWDTWDYHGLLDLMGY